MDPKFAFSQYQMYVEMADRISQRRGQDNRFYVTLLSALFAVFSWIINIQKESQILPYLMIFMGIFGILLCSIWWFNIRSYRQLNSGKFKVIHEMEVELPFQPYTREWEILKKGHPVGYRQLTKIEQYLPLLISIPYIIIIIIGLWYQFG